MPAICCPCDVEPVHFSPLRWVPFRSALQQESGATTIQVEKEGEMLAGVGGRMVTIHGGSRARNVAQYLIRCDHNALITRRTSTESLTWMAVDVIVAVGRSWRIRQMTTLQVEVLEGVTEVSPKALGVASRATYLCQTSWCDILIVGATRTQ